MWKTKQRQPRHQLLERGISEFRSNKGSISLSLLLFANIHLAEAKSDGPLLLQLQALVQVPRIVVGLLFSNISLILMLIRMLSFIPGRHMQGWVPSLLFPVYIKNIQKKKHGDDTENYDEKGSFFSDDFEMLLSGLGPLKSPNKLKLTELWKMPVDIIQWIKEKVGWTALYYLARLEAISLSKEAEDFNRTLYMARKQAETKVKSS